MQSSGVSSGPRSDSPNAEGDTLLEPITHSSANIEAETTMAPTKNARNGGGMRDTIGLGLVLGGSVLFVVITFVLVLLGGKGFGWFTFHPTLQSLSIVSLVLGITPLQPPPANNLERGAKFDTHQKYILRLSSPLMLLGTAAIWWNKYIRSATHFTSWHSWFGLLSISLMVMQGVMGVGMAWYGTQMFGSERDAKRVYKYHRLSGYILVFVILTTAYLGGAQSMWAKRMEGMYRIIGFVAYWVGIPAIGVGLLTGIRTSKMQFT